MANHISARLAWHQDGWNGHICKNPQSNTFCVGSASYPGELIGETRDLAWEMKEDVAGQACNILATKGEMPPCVYSINAFGKEKIKAFSRPPEWFNDGSQVKYWDVPPATVCVWPYEEMYLDDVKNEKGTFDYDKRLERAKQFFNELTPNSTLIFYYANYSNPFSEDDAKKYVLVGVSRLKDVGEYMFYEGTSVENQQKYAGGFVWQMPITSHYPDQGFCIPYHHYFDNSQVLEKLVFVPDNERNFKYATRKFSDDDALELVEQLIQIVDYLSEIGDKSEDWVIRKEWLQLLVAELWQSRGAYPGLPNILGYIKFPQAISYLKRQAAKDCEKEAKLAIFNFLNNQVLPLEISLRHDEKSKISRSWSLMDDDERELLENILVRFDITGEQIDHLLCKKVEHGFDASIQEIITNPYLICEEYVGDDVDDQISFTKIDHGIMPSPELGIEPLAESDAGIRLRALCVERLKKENKHTFISLVELLHQVNNKLSFLPEWKRHQFSERYFKVDRDILEKSLVFVEQSAKQYVYLKTVYEDERSIEKQIRFLSTGQDITFRSPVTENHWQSFLHESHSPLTRLPDEYSRAITGQIEVCKRVFTKPICVVAGTAGTGKTTIVKAIIQAVEKAHGGGTSFQLLAPTGKAADRLRERTGKSANTIHSFLAQRGWLKDNMTFKRNGGRIEAGITTYIIDESSMLDLNLTATLFKAINWKSVQRLIFVGDPNQLPPIGRGKIFADIIEWLGSHFPECVGTLVINLRQMENRILDKGTGILSLAQLYIQRKSRGESEAEEAKNQAEEFLRKVQEGGEVDKDLRVLYWKNGEDLQDILATTICDDLVQDSGQSQEENRLYELLREACKDDKGNERPEYMEVISPYRGEMFGTESINSMLQNLINGHNTQRGLLGGITLFDKVIQSCNRPKSNPYWAYNLKMKKMTPVEIYNGEIGFVKPHAFDKKWKWNNYQLEKFQIVFSRKEEYWIDFCSKGEVEQNLELAYAISVHKAQGSEFQRVYFILPKNKKTLLSSELIYTGITRAQKHLTLLVEEDISPLLSLRRPERSHLAMIQSSLFEFKPLPDAMVSMRQWYEEGKIHQTLAEQMVRSKSEVIISNMLFDRDIPFTYETPLFASDGTFYLPDFTITWRGESWYWEHLGLMHKAEYKNHQETKKKWYDKFFPGRLITTIESGNLSKDAEELILKYFS